MILLDLDNEYRQKAKIRGANAMVEYHVGGGNDAVESVVDRRMLRLSMFSDAVYEIWRELRRG